MSDDVPSGFGVRRDLHDVIYKIDPEEVPFVSKLGRMGAEQILDEYARGSPRFAAERRQRKRQLKAWQRERDRLAHEVGMLQVPFVVALINPNPSDRNLEAEDVAAVMLKVSNFLFEHNAPSSLIRDLLRLGKRLLPE